MARINKNAAQNVIRTHEGGYAERTTHEQALRRSVMSCFLWEDEFYENGVSIADRIRELSSKVDAKFVSDLAFEARSQGKLRHVPLLLLETITRRNEGSLVADSIFRTIQRADEMGEFLSICKKMGMKTLSNQMKNGLARAFMKFDEYQLAKYDRDSDEFKIRDVMFLSHPKPDTPERKALFKRVANREMKTPDTWEVALSGGADKKETFERLLKEGNLGYLALLRNLRNMAQAGCDKNLIRNAILARQNGADKVLPFRFVAAARAAPQFEPELDSAMQESIKFMPMLDGETVIVVDVSGSMKSPLSSKSDLQRIDAACALAVIANCKHKTVFSFSNETVLCPARNGMAGIDAIRISQSNSSTRLAEAINDVNNKMWDFDRLIVVTDEQHNGESHLPKPNSKRNYMINVGSYKNGIGYGSNWTHIDGFSENVFRFIAEKESLGH